MAAWHERLSALDAIFLDADEARDLPSLAAGLPAALAELEAHLLRGVAP